MIHKRDRNTSLSSSGEQLRKKRFKLAPLGTATATSLPSTSSQVREKPVPTDRNELLILVRLYMINSCDCRKFQKLLLFQIKNSIDPIKYQRFLPCLQEYRADADVNKLIEAFKYIFSDPETYYLFRAMGRFVKEEGKAQYDMCIAELEAQLQFFFLLCYNIEYTCFCLTFFCFFSVWWESTACLVQCYQGSFQTGT